MFKKILTAIVLAVGLNASAFAEMSTAQLQTLKAAIDGDPTLSAQPMNSDGAFEIARALNLTATPDFWVWRTEVPRSAIYNETSGDATTWSWTIYKAQAVAEQNAWVQMFMGDRADFSKPNLRAGVTAIFGGANANTLHALAIARRKATRAEKILATGTGSTGSPAVMSFEGSLTYPEVEAARAQ